MPSGYDYLNHIVAVRMRVRGSGTFLSRLAALADDPEQELADTTLQNNPNRPVNVLANISAPRMQFHGQTEEIDEYFVIKNITFFVKPIATGYPQ